MNFLCKMSLTYSWETLGKYLDAFMENKLLHICKKASIDVPIILLMDNINVYRGNKKYHRLFATFCPKMWNFTGRGIFFPNIEGIEHLFSESQTASESQRDIINLVAEDLTIDSNDPHLEIWNDWKDKFLLQGLDACLNRFPRSLDLTSVNEKGFDDWLKKFKPYRKNDNYKITMKDDFSSHLPTGVQKKSDVSVLPLSLENNSTVAGAGASLQEFGSMIDIPCKQPPTYLPYDSANKVFSLKQARTHCEYVRLLDDHQKDMIEFKKQLDNAERRLKTKKTDKTEVASDSVSKSAMGEIRDDEDILLGVKELEGDGYNSLQEIQQLLEQDKEFCFLEECDNESGKDTEILGSSTLAAKKKLFDDEDKIFFSTYNKLQSKLWKYLDKGHIDMYVEYLKTKQETLLTCRDHLLL